MAYLAGDPLTNVARQLVEGPASSGQNIIPIPGGFTPGMVDVAVGGAVLSHGDYDDSDGMNIKLTLAMAQGTQYRVVSYAPGQTVQNIQLSTPLSFRNYVVDGNFESWINSSVNLPAATWSNSAATMYYAYSGTGGTATVSLAPFGVGNEPLGMTSPIKNTLMYQQTGQTTSGGAIIQQNMESVLTAHGRSVTFSLWLFTTSGTLGIGSVFINQNFGTGGSPSAGNYLAIPVSWQLTTTPQRFSVRIDVPSVQGKTLGTNNNDYFSVGINLPGNALYTIRTAQWQVEPCAATAPAAGTPTPFEYRGVQAELARVQRFYEVGYFNVRDYINSTTQTMTKWQQYSTGKRGNAATAVLNPLYSNASGATTDTSTANGFRMIYYSGTANPISEMSCNWSADARL